MSLTKKACDQSSSVDVRRALDGSFLMLVNLFKSFFLSIFFYLSERRLNFKVCVE